MTLAIVLKARSPHVPQLAILRINSLTKYAGPRGTVVDGEDGTATMPVKFPSQYAGITWESADIVSEERATCMENTVFCNFTTHMGSDDGADHAELRNELALKIITDLEDRYCVMDAQGKKTPIQFPPESSSEASRQASVSLAVRMIKFLDRWCLFRRRLTVCGLYVAADKK